MIAIGNASGVRVTGGVSSDTFAFTCSGSDRFLVVHCLSNNGANPITGVTYAGVAMTKAGSTRRSGEGFDTDTYYLKNPASGSNNVVITASGSVAIVSECANYTGVDQSYTPVVASTVGNSASISHSITVANNDSWIFTGTRTGGAEPSATGTNYVRRISNASNGVHIGDTNATVTSGSKTVSVSVTSGAWGVLLMEIKAAGSIAQAVTASAKVSASIATVKDFVRTLTGATRASATTTQKKTFLRTLTGAVSAGATITKANLLFKTLTAAISAGATTAEASINAVVLSASLTAQATITNIKSLKTTLTANIDASAVVTQTKTLYRALTAAITSSAAITSTKTFFQTLTASIRTSAVITRGDILRTVVLNAIIKARGSLGELFYKIKYRAEEETYTRKHVEAEEEDYKRKY